MSAAPNLLLIFIVSCWLSNGISGRVSGQWTNKFATYSPQVPQLGNTNWDGSGSVNTFLHPVPQFGVLNNEFFPGGSIDSTQGFFYPRPQFSNTWDDSEATLPSGSKQSMGGLFPDFPQFNNMNWDASDKIFPNGFILSNNGFSNNVPQLSNSDWNGGFNSKGSSEPTSGFSQFEQECLDEHNRLRAKHGAPALRLSRNLNKYAQEWANYMANNGVFHHRSTRVYGENLFMSNGGHVDGRTAVRSWYDEVRLYKYGSGFSKSTGHFTQVVWKGSKELGCALARRGNSVYVVANYSPSGNYQGQFSSNVLPPQRLI